MTLPEGHASNWMAALGAMPVATSTSIAASPSSALVPGSEQRRVHLRVSSRGKPDKPKVER